MIWDFFSFVTELVYRDVKSKVSAEKAAVLKLGYVTMKTNFTQIYDKTKTQTLRLLERENETSFYSTDMPEIHDAEETLEDIYKKTTHSSVMKLITKNAELSN